MALGWRGAARIAAFGLLALLLGACLKLDMDLEVSADDTVSGSVIFGVNKELLELTGGSAEDLLGTEAPLPESAEGVTVEPFEDDEFQGQRFVFDGVPIEEFSSGGPDELQITREGDVFRVSGALDLSSGLTGATGPTGFGAEEFLRGAELEVTIAFPGEVTQSNGEVDGNTVTWIPVVGERLELHATASAIDTGSGASNLAVLLVVAAVVVAAAIIVIIVVVQRRGRPAPATGFGEAVGAPLPTGSDPAPTVPQAPTADLPPPPPPSDRQP